MTTNDQPSGSDALWDAWRGILYTQAAILHQVERDLEAHSGISIVFLDVLSCLDDAPDGRLRMQELQEHSLFTRTGMTRLVDRVEKAGLVRRERVAGDRRGVSVVITPEGTALYREAMARHREDVERVFDDRLTPGQQSAVAGALLQFRPR